MIAYGRGLVNPVSASTLGCCLALIPGMAVNHALILSLVLLCSAVFSRIPSWLLMGSLMKPVQ